MAYVLDPARSLSDEVRRIASERIAEAVTALDAIDGSAGHDGDGGHDDGDSRHGGDGRHGDNGPDDGDSRHGGDGRHGDEDGSNDHDRDRVDPDLVEEAVHDARKRAKEGRALARLVRSQLGSEYKRFDRDLRDAARTLAPIRDSHAVLETFDELRVGRANADDPHLDRVRAGHAEAASGATGAVLGGDPRVERARELFLRAGGRIERWDIDDRDVLRAGLRDSYRRGRVAFRRARAEPSDEHVHEWRKAVKHLWYQVRLVERAAPSVLGPLVATLDDLADALGDDHDLAVLVEQMSAEPERFGGKPGVKRARRLARRQQDELRHRAFRLAETIYAEKPKAFARRIGTYWKRTSRHGVELPTGGIADLLADEQATARDASGATVSTERERKFLVVRVPELNDDGEVLRQGYLAIDGSASVRVRDAGPGGCTMTIKAGRGATRTEIEVPLDEEQFATAWQHTTGRRIHKTRHRIDADGDPVELDVFHDDLAGLVIAEVEFDSDEAMAAFTPPDWFGTEVTDDDAYTNASLSLHPPPSIPATGAR